MELHAPLNGRFFFFQAHGEQCFGNSREPSWVCHQLIQWYLHICCSVGGVWNSLIDQILQTLPSLRVPEEIFFVPCGTINELLNMKNTLKGTVSMLPVDIQRVNSSFIGQIWTSQMLPADGVLCVCDTGCCHLECPPTPFIKRQTGRIFLSSELKYSELSHPFIIKTQQLLL